MRTAPPARANSLVTACTAALAPTSMPLVGSSRISTPGLRASHFGDHHLLLIAAGQADARVARVPDALMPRRPIHWRASSDSRATLHQPRGASVARLGNAMFAATENGRHRCPASAGLRAPAPLPRSSREREGTGTGRVDAEQHLRKLGTPRAHQTVYARLFLRRVAQRKHLRISPARHRCSTRRSSAPG